MRDSKDMLTWSSLKDATDICNSLFVKCRNIPTLAKDGQIENHELEFRRLMTHWEDRNSLEYYISYREEKKEAIFGLLYNIKKTLEACLCIAHDTQYNGHPPNDQTRDGDSTSPPTPGRNPNQDLNSDASATSDETSTTEEETTEERLVDLQLEGQKRYLDIFLGSLTRRLALVRTQASELRPQFCEADLRFGESHYEELRRYLATLVLVQPYELSLFNRLSRTGLTGVGIVARAWLTDISRLSAVQARLIDGVMRRRHRIVFATKFMPNSSSRSKYKDSDPQCKYLGAPQPRNEGWLETCDDSPLSTGSSDLLQAQPLNTPPLAKSIEPSTLSRFSRIMPTQDYPPRPNYMAGGAAPNCPFCGDHLSNRDIDSKAAWRSHVAGDLQPYTCVSEQCETPMKFFLTSSDWLQHVTEEHSSWACDGCKEPRLEPNTFTKPDFLAHMDGFHVRASDKEALKVDGGQFLSPQHSKNIIPMRCPLCNYRSNPVDIEFDDHIPEHIHSFSLQALPWGNKAFFVSSEIKCGVTDEEYTGHLSSIANNFRPLPTANPKTPPPKDSEKSEHINWTLDVRSHTHYDRVTWKRHLIDVVLRRNRRQIQNLDAGKNTFVLIHNDSILFQHWPAVESLVLESALSGATLPNRTRLYFTSEPEEVHVFTRRRIIRLSAVAKVRNRLRIHRPTRTGNPSHIVQTSSQPTQLPEINRTEVERWIESTPLGPTVGVKAVLDAMDHICNNIKETQAEETGTKGPATTVLMIFTSQDWSINIWTSAFHRLADLISERADRPDPLPIHITFIMIGDKAQVDNTAVFDLWKDVLTSSISSTVLDDSISTQLDPDGHIVKMSGRFPGPDFVVSRAASAAATPADRTKSAAVLESFPSYRLHWTSLRQCLKVLFPTHAFGDTHEVESHGRYYFSVPRHLTSEEKDYLWHLAVGNRGYGDSIVVDETPISSPTKTSFVADISSGRKKFLLVMHLGIAAPPDGSLHLGSIVADIRTFEPLGSGKPPAALPSRTFTRTSQNVKIQLPSPRTDEHIELDVKQLDKIWFQPSHEDVLGAMGDPDVEEFVQHQELFVRPVVYMVTGLLVAKDGRAIRRKTQEMEGEGKGVAVEGITAGATTSYENVVQRQWEHNLVVGIRVHKIIRKKKSIAIREHVSGAML